MSTLWITGARGFIGRHLALHLARSGHTVAGVGHGLWTEREHRAWGISHWLNGDIEASTLEALASVTGVPERIYHTAGGSSVGASLNAPYEDFSRTTVTTARLIEWIRLRAPAAHLVTLSSAAVYGAAYSGAIAEDARPEPSSPYGHNKLMMEQLCRSYAESFEIQCSVVRLFSVYGPWLRKQLLWDLCTKLSSGDARIELGGTGEEVRDWVEIDDVVKLLETVGSHIRDGTSVINGGTGIGTPVATVARMALEAWGSEAVLSFTGTRRNGDPFSLVADATTLRQRGVGVEVQLKEGLERYVRWFRGNST